MPRARAPVLDPASAAPHYHAPRTRSGARRRVHAIAQLTGLVATGEKATTTTRPGRIGPRVACAVHLAWMALMALRISPRAGQRAAVTVDPAMAALVLQTAMLYTRISTFHHVARIHAYARAVLEHDTPLAAVGFLHHAMLFWAIFFHETRVGATLRRRAHPPLQRAHALACAACCARAGWAVCARRDLAAAGRLLVAVAA